MRSRNSRWHTAITVAASSRRCASVSPPQCFSPRSRAPVSRFAGRPLLSNSMAGQIESPSRKPVAASTHERFRTLPRASAEWPKQTDGIYRRITSSTSKQNLATRMWRHFHYSHDGRQKFEFRWRRLYLLHRNHQHVLVSWANHFTPAYFLGHGL